MPTKAIFVRTIAAGLILLPLAACDAAKDSKAAATTADASTARPEVQALIANILDGYNQKNADKAVSADAPDFVAMTHGAKNTVGAAADLAETKKQVADPAVRLAVSNESYDVAASGDLVVYRSTYAYSFTDPKTKKPTTETGNWVAGFKRQADGTMKMTWGVVSDTPATKTAAK